MDNSDYKDDEVIEVRLSRNDYNRLKEILARERAYSWFTSRIKTSWVFIVGGGLLTFILLYEKFQLALFGTVK